MTQKDNIIDLEWARSKRQEKIKKNKKRKSAAPYLRNQTFVIWIKFTLFLIIAAYIMRQCSH